MNTLRKFGAGLAGPEPSLRHPDSVLVGLRHGSIKKIYSFALGPEGTNLARASREWLEHACLMDKSVIVLCQTPEECLAEARKITNSGEVAIFWTCAVFYALKDMFFGNPDVYPFAIVHRSRLDKMQVAIRKELFPLVEFETWSFESCTTYGGDVFPGDPIFPESWSIAAHPSPTPLLAGLKCKFVPASSNSAAAEMCARGDVEACITTESARTRTGLAKLHEFGSPDMIFFGGMTAHGFSELHRSQQRWALDIIT